MERERDSYMCVTGERVDGEIDSYMCVTGERVDGERDSYMCVTGERVDGEIDSYMYVTGERVDGEGDPSESAIDRATTAPAKTGRRNWLANSINLKTSRGQRVKVRAPSKSLSCRQGQGSR